MELYTIGHSTRTVAELVEALRAWRIETVIDVRKFPRSRTNPQFNADVLPAAIARAGLDYAAIAALGGRRSRVRTVEPMVNEGWRVSAFHNYADYALSSAFFEGLAELFVRAHRARCVVMCAEAVWWRCHRRIIADHALARGVFVRHVFDADKCDDARLTPFARVRADGSVVYPADAALVGSATRSRAS